MKVLTRFIGVVVMALLVPLLAASPAEAQQRVRHDPAGDANGGGDIRKLVVMHQQRRVVIKVVFVSRRQARPEEMWLRIDRPNTRRWDYELGTGSYYPRTYSIWHRRQSPSDDPKCSLRRRNNDGRTIELIVPRRCFNRPHRVRVRVKWSDINVQDDIMGNPNSFDRTWWTRYARRG